MDLFDDKLCGINDLFVNDQWEAVGNIKPTRGLKQGDPFSPYLFLLCAQGLSGLLNRAKEEKRIHGVTASKKGPKVTHLFFADCRHLILFGFIMVTFNLVFKESEN